MIDCSLSLSLPQLFPSERVVISPRELVLFDVRPEDEGFYFCMAKNEVGEITSNRRLGQLNVWSEFPATVGLLPLRPHSCEKEQQFCSSTRCSSRESGVRDIGLRLFV